jgi:hypothetical protein
MTVYENRPCSYYRFTFLYERALKFSMPSASTDKGMRIGLVRNIDLSPLCMKIGLVLHVDLPPSMPMI